MKVPVTRLKRSNSLKKNYYLAIQTGLILTLSILIVLFKIEIRPVGEENVLVISEQEEVFIEEIVQTKQEIKAPPPPRPMVPVEVPNDEILEDEFIDIDAELDLESPMEMPLPPKPPAADNDEEYEDEVFIVVENPPVLIGGIQSVQKHIVYPDLALKAGIEGRVVVQFIVGKDGEIINPVVLRGIGGGCDEEAIRAVMKAKFQPGMQRGRPVAVKYSLPISFRIYNKDS